MNAILKTFALAASWLVGFSFMYFFSGTAEAKLVYAVIVGWWLTAYVSGRIAALPYVALGLGSAYFVLAFVAYLFGFVVNEDFQTASFIQYVGVLFFQSIVFASPVFFDILFRKVQEYLVPSIR